ncbi:MAG: hypothetical protein FJ225_06105 [Lentisphaerae bacterium]|nr:hypothetical protein [Lentisphaerota bacterium]
MNPILKRPGAAALALWIAAFSLSCRIGGPPRAGVAPDVSPSVMGVLLAGSRLTLGDHFYEVADQYFHRGVPHKSEKFFGGNWFQRMAAEAAPSAHLHLQGVDVREMMPWLLLSMRANPGRAESYLVTAFWLDHGAGRPDAALEVLRQGQCEVPFNYEIQLERGRLLLRLGRRGPAAAAFDAGLAFWPGAGDPGGIGARHDKAALLLYRALLHEGAGEREEAIAALERILALFPEREHLRERIALLRSGGAPALAAPALWKQLLAADARAREENTCPQAEARDHDHEDE